MKTTYQLILTLHIIGGFTALLVAPIAMIVKKGGKTHRKWGKVYFIAMCLVSLSSTIMCIMKVNIFLGMVGIFSFYHVATGYRAIYRRNINSLKQLPAIDWLFLVVTGFFNLGLVVLGGWLLMKNITEPFGYISMLLGSIGVRSVAGDFLSFKPGHHKENWMYHHMGGMIGGYIATVSAFSVVNLTFLPLPVRWLWPVAVGLPLLFYWIGKYKKQKALMSQ
jgi:uncharacterized membrane protein